MDHLSIGRFSELTALTIKALRLYGRLGVLPPAVVDLSSGYRYYTPDQVDVARRIQRLRALDMPLEEIRALLAERDAAAARARLRRHRELLKQRFCVALMVF